ncbi:hypothetical protein RIVM261_071480 [Rivularia sp. IAM M-261]|nr:hypothetical protein RIVM261_071480 [Rivularia sp. IAM M-261]
MLPKFRQTFILVAVVAALSTGCRYQKEYSKITEAGNQYTTAVDQLLSKASDLQVDASSEQLLLDDKLSNQTQEAYDNLNKQDQEMLQIISDMREHNRLLQRYFHKLRQLARSDAPEETQKEIDGIASNIQTISSRLQTSSFFANRGILGRVGKLVINAKIDGALRKELEKRDNTILQELTIQESMLGSLKGFMEHRIKLIQDARETRLLIRPLIDKEPIEAGLAQTWIDERRQMFLFDQHIVEIKNASSALKEFKDIYKASVEGNINSARLNNALEDINTFLALLVDTKQTINSTN